MTKTDKEAILGYVKNKNIDVHSFESVVSTNDVAKEMLRNGAERSFVVTANHQSGGRGRQGKSFYSPDGTGIYMSVALVGEETPKTLFVTSAVSVILCRAIYNRTGKQPLIKWVNDLYLDGRKICGILTESVRDIHGNLLGMVIGIGINITTSEFPEDIKDIAASLNCDVDKNKLIATIAEMITQENLDDSDEYLTEYKKLSMVLGKDILYYKDNVAYYGKAVDIDSKGALVVEADGSTEVLDSGEITLRLR